VRIAWVSHEGFLGGAQLSFLEAARGMVDRGHTIHAILPEREDLAGPLEHAGVTVSVHRYTWWAVVAGPWRAPGYRLRRLARNLVAARHLARFFRDWRPDVVVSNTLAVPAGAFGARLARVPHAWYVHELVGEENDLYFDLGVPLSLGLMDRLSARLVACSRAVRDQLQRRIPASKIRVVYYAVEVPPQAPPPPSADGVLRLVMASRLAPAKRQEDAVRALGMLAKRGVRARLELIGRERPDYGERLRRLAREGGVLDRVDFRQFGDDPHGHVAAADVALMCSRGEGFGRITVEAMKVGRPVVGADSGATPDLIRDGWNGLLYRPGDAADLAAKLEGLWRDRARLQSMGLNAQAWSREAFSLDRHIPDLLAALAECVS
jgi:glycosyltransferase involved in cell wall biosynthesis